MPKRLAALRRKRARKVVTQPIATTSSPAWTPDLERLYELMFGTSGDPEQEYRAYQDYWGFDPRNRIH